MKEFTMGLFLCVVLAILFLGALPFWSHMRSREWGYLPSAVFGLLLVGLAVLLYNDVIGWR
jgi:hypothetical protein